MHGCPGGWFPLMIKNIFIRILIIIFLISIIFIGYPIAKAETYSPIGYSLSGYVFLINSNNLSYYDVSVKGLVPMKFLDKSYVFNNKTVTVHFYVNCTINSSKYKNIKIIENNSSYNESISIILPARCLPIKYPIIWSYSGDVEFNREGNIIKINLNIKIKRFLTEITIINESERTYNIHINKNKINIPSHIIYEIAVNTTNNEGRIIKINKIKSDIQLGYNPFYLCNIKNARDFTILKSKDELKQKYLDYTLYIKPIINNNKLMFIKTYIPLNIGFYTYKNFLKEIIPGKPLLVEIHQGKDIDLRDYFNNIKNYKSLILKLEKLKYIVNESSNSIVRCYPATFLPIKLKNNTIKLFSWATEPGITDIGCYICGYPIKGNIESNNCVFNFILPLNSTSNYYLFFVVDELKYKAGFDPIASCPNGMGSINTASTTELEIILILIIISIIYLYFRTTRA